MGNTKSDNDGNLNLFFPSNNQQKSDFSPSNSKFLKVPELVSFRLSAFPNTNLTRSSHYHSHSDINNAGIICTITN